IKSWKQGLWSPAGSSRRIRNVYFISVFSFLGLVLGDLDIAVGDPGLAVLQADESVFEPGCIIALGEVKPVVRPTRLLPQERPKSDDLGYIDHIAELEEVDDGLAVAEALPREKGPTIVLPDLPDCLQGLLELLFRPEDARLIAHNDLKVVEQMMGHFASGAAEPRIHLRLFSRRLIQNVLLVAALLFQPVDKIRRLPAGDLAEDDGIEEGIPPQPVGAGDAHAGALAGRVKSRQRRGGAHIPLDPAHRIVLGGV